MQKANLELSEERGVGGLGETSEGIKQQKQKQKNLIDTDNSMVISRGKGE